MLIPVVGGKSKVCIQSWMGTYVCAEKGGGHIVVVNRPEAKEWETFEIHRISEDEVTIKSHNGQFLCAENGGGTIVVANRNEPSTWETFKLNIDQNGLIVLTAANGQFLCADISGVLVADRDNAKEWESFYFVDPSMANVQEQTQIQVNVYKIGTSPIWHTGTVIEGTEYYFNTNNHVEHCKPKGMDLIHHRTMVRVIPGNIERVKSILDSVIKRWDGTRYDLGGHNCNFFTNDLLNSLNAGSLDQEYLNASGLGKGLKQFPGGSTLQEILVKWPIHDKRVDQSFMDDLKKLVRLPRDIIEEIERFHKRIGNAISDVFRF